jgi:hypothetical protein
MCGELAALIGIHDLRLAMAMERLLQHIDGMAGFQRDCSRSWMEKPCCGVHWPRCRSVSSSR